MHLKTDNRAATAAKDWSLASFGSHLNPISTRGGRLCPPYTGVLGWLTFAVAALDKVDFKKKPPRKNFFLQSPHLAYMKNVVECPREFLAYFNALET